MARSILDLTNVEPADSIYPYGRIKNNTGTFNGTPVKEDLLGDMSQFFQKLMDVSGITPSHLPDNENNGWQLYDAYLKAMFGELKTPTYMGDFIDGPKPIRYRLMGANHVIIRGTTAANTPASYIANTPIFTLPAAYWPKETRIFSCFQNDGTLYHVAVQVNDVGVVSLRGDLTHADSDSCEINIEFDND